MCDYSIVVVMIVINNDKIYLEYGFVIHLMSVLAC